jgi:hypothetical protein
MGLSFFKLNWKNNTTRTTIPPTNTPNDSQSKGPRSNSYRLMGISSLQLARIFYELTSRDCEDGHAIPRKAGKDAHIRSRSHAEAWLMKYPGQALYITGKNHYVKILSGDVFTRRLCQFVPKFAQRVSGL